jgi:hypothetical protein
MNTKNESIFIPHPFEVGVTTPHDVYLDKLQTRGIKRSILYM